MSSRFSPKRVLFGAAALAAIVFAFLTLADQFRALRATGGLAQLRIGWSSLGAATTLVLVAYLILIETWRRVVNDWEGDPGAVGKGVGTGAPARPERLSFADATRIWCVSNLGRYLPGKVWQVAAMAVMARHRGVSAVAATGSSLLVNLVNVMVGFALVAATGAEVLGAPRATIPLVVVSGLVLGLLPQLIAVAARLVRRLTGSEFALRRIPGSSLWTAAAGCLTAWIIYGLAFRLFVVGVLGVAPGSAAGYVAAFTGSYLLGYIAIFAPGGIGVRELSLVTALERLRLGVAGGAGLVALASRVWLTATEVAPGLLLLAYDAWRGNGRQRPNG